MAGDNEPIRMEARAGWNGDGYYVQARECEAAGSGGKVALCAYMETACKASRGEAVEEMKRMVGPGVELMWVDRD